MDNNNQETATMENPNQTDPNNGGVISKIYSTNKLEEKGISIDKFKEDLKDEGFRHYIYRHGLKSDEFSDVQGLESIDGFNALIDNELGTTQKNEPPAPLKNMDPPKDEETGEEDKETMAIIQNLHTRPEKFEDVDSNQLEWKEEGITDGEEMPLYDPTVGMSTDTAKPLNESEAKKQKTGINSWEKAKANIASDAVENQVNDMLEKDESVYKKAIGLYGSEEEYEKRIAGLGSGQLGRARMDDFSLDMYADGLTKAMSKKKDRLARKFPEKDTDKILNSYLKVLGTDPDAMKKIVSENKDIFSDSTTREWMAMVGEIGKVYQTKNDLIKANPEWEAYLEEQKDYRNKIETEDQGGIFGFNPLTLNAPGFSTRRAVTGATGRLTGNVGSVLDAMGFDGMAAWANDWGMYMEDGGIQRSDWEGAAIETYKPATVDGEDYRVIYDDEEVVGIETSNGQTANVNRAKHKAILESASKNEASTQYSLKPFIKQTVDVGLDMAPIIAITAASGGIGSMFGAAAGSTVATNVGVVLGGSLQVFGPMYKELLKNPNITEGEAAMWATGASLTSGAVSLINPVEGRLVQGGMINSVKHHTAKVLNGTLSKKEFAKVAMSQMFKSGIKEVPEELVQENVEIYSKKMLNQMKPGIGTPDDSSMSFHDALEISAVSLVVGALGESGRLLPRKSSKIDGALGLAVSNPDKIDDFITGMQKGIDGIDDKDAQSKAQEQLDVITKRWNVVKEHLPLMEDLDAKKRGELVKLIAQGNDIRTGDLLDASTPALKKAATESLNEIDQKIEELLSGEVRDNSAIDKNEVDKNATDAFGDLGADVEFIESDENYDDIEENSDRDLSSFGEAKANDIITDKDGNEYVVNGKDEDSNILGVTNSEDGTTTTIDVDNFGQILGSEFAEDGEISVDEINGNKGTFALEVDGKRVLAKEVDSDGNLIYEEYNDDGTSERKTIPSESVDKSVFANGRVKNVKRKKYIDPKAKRRENVRPDTNRAWEVDDIIEFEDGSRGTIVDSEINIDGSTNKYTIRDQKTGVERTVDPSNRGSIVGKTTRQDSKNGGEIKVGEEVEFEGRPVSVTKVQRNENGGVESIELKISDESSGAVTITNFENQSGNKKIFKHESIKFTESEIYSDDSRSGEAGKSREDGKPDGNDGGKGVGVSDGDSKKTSGKTSKGSDKGKRDGNAKEESTAKNKKSDVVKRLKDLDRREAEAMSRLDSIKDKNKRALVKKKVKAAFEKERLSIPEKAREDRYRQGIKEIENERNKVLRDLKKEHNEEISIYQDLEKQNKGNEDISFEEEIEEAERKYEYEREKIKKKYQDKIDDFAVESNVDGGFNNAQAKRVRKKKIKHIIDNFVPHDAYHAALLYFAGGGKINHKSYQKEFSRESWKDVLWIHGMDKNAPTVSAVGHQIWEESNHLIDESDASNAVIEVMGSFGGVEQVRYALIEIYESSDQGKDEFESLEELENELDKYGVEEPARGNYIEAYLERIMTPEEREAFYYEKQKEYVESLSEDEQRAYYEEIERELRDEWENLSPDNETDVMSIEEIAELEAELEKEENQNEQNEESKSESENESESESESESKSKSESESEKESTDETDGDTDAESESETAEGEEDGVDPDEDIDTKKSDTKKSDTKKSDKPTPKPKKSAKTKIKEDRAKRDSKRKGLRKVRDEKASKDIGDAWSAFKKAGKNNITSGGLDPEKIEKGTTLIGLYIKNGVYKFSDIVSDAYYHIGDELQDIFHELKAVYAAYYNTTDDATAELMDGSVRGIKYDDVINDELFDSVDVEDDVDAEEDAQPQTNESALREIFPEDQASSVETLFDRVLGNIAKRSGKTLSKLKRSVAVRTVSDVEATVDKVRTEGFASLQESLGLSNELNTDFSEVSEDNVNVLYQKFNEVKQKFAKNLGLEKGDYILNALLENEASFNFLGFDKKLSGLGNKENIQAEIERRLEDLSNRINNSNEFFIEEFTDGFLINGYIQANTLQEKQMYLEMLNGNQELINAQIEHRQNEQRRQLQNALSYLLPSSQYSTEFKYLMIGSVLRGNQAQDVTIYEADPKAEIVQDESGKVTDIIPSKDAKTGSDRSVKRIIPGKKVKRNNKTVGLFQELSPMVLPDVYKDLQDPSNNQHPMELIDKHTDKSYIGYEETSEIIKDRIVKETSDGVWVKFDKSSEPSDAHALKMVSKKVEKAFESGDNPWCTGGGAADTYLPNGDFYVFLDKSLEPKITIRYEGDRIAELKGTGKGQQMRESENNIAKPFLSEIPNGEAYLDNVKTTELYYKLKRGDIDNPTREEVKDFFSGKPLETYDHDIKKEYNRLKDEYFDTFKDLAIDKYKLYDDIVKDVDVDYFTNRDGSDNVLVFGPIYLGEYDSSPELKLSGITFSKKVVLYRYASSTPLDLSNTTFNGEVDLSEYSSEEGLDLSGATFNGGFYLKGYSSEAGLDLSAATFNGDVYLDEYSSSAPLDLSNATFNSDFRLNEYHGSAKIKFKNAVFNGETRIMGYSGRKGLDLSTATFNGSLDLSSYNGLYPLDIRWADINGDLYLGGYVANGGLDLSGMSFEGQVYIGGYQGTGLDLTNTDFLSNVGLRNIWNQKLDLSETRFQGNVDLTGTDYTGYVLNQDSRGAIITTPESTLILLDKNNADITTPIHEITHKYEEVLTDEEVATLEEWSGHKKGTTEFSEAFAVGAEKYLYEGPSLQNGKVDSILKKFSEWFQNAIEDAISYFGSINDLTPEVRDVYAKMLQDPKKINNESKNKNNERKSGRSRNTRKKLGGTHQGQQQKLLFGVEGDGEAGRGSQKGNTGVSPNNQGTKGNGKVSSGRSGRGGSKGTISTVDGDGTTPRENFTKDYDVEEEKSFNKKKKFSDNIKALELLATLVEENRDATQEEKVILDKYVGWGGLSIVLKNMDSKWSDADEKFRPLMERLEALYKRFDDLGYPGSKKVIKRSTKTSFYTPTGVVKGVYKLLTHMGVTSGSFLEPSAGIGNFIGLMPKSMRENSRITGVEMEPFSALILSKLYPKIDAKNSQYESLEYASNSFDVIVSNIPFGDMSVFVGNNAPKILKKAGSKIHNYFFVRALDQVKEGGIVAFVTSAGTLDSRGNKFIREHLNENANFLGAIRLPNTTFKGNAGTSPVSDIIFLQKQTKGQKDNSPFLEVEKVEVEGKDGNLVEINVNEYFVQNPTHVLGRFKAGGQFSDTDMDVVPSSDASLESQISDIMESFPKNVFDPQNTTDSDVDTDIEIDYAAIGDYNMFKNEDGEVIYLVNGKVKHLAQKHKDKGELFIKIRDTLLRQYNLEVNSTDDAAVEENRDRLNKLYDTYVRRFGNFNHKDNAPFIKKDKTQDLIFSLEIENEDGSYSKDPIFSKRQLKPAEIATSADNILDAIAISINENAKVDISKIADLMGLSYDQVVEKYYGDFFFDENGKAVSKAEYLSGNVKDKLDAAKLKAVDNPIYENNIKALEEVQPQDLENAEIDVNLGSIWVPVDVYQEFIAELFEVDPARVKVVYDPTSSEYIIDGPRSAFGTNKYGVRRTGSNSVYSEYKLLSSAMHGRIPSITMSVSRDGVDVRVKDSKAIDEAKNKIDALRDAFEDWIWRDVERADRLNKIYNRKHNTTVLRSHDGSKITIPGLNGISLYDHQLDAISMLLMNGGGIIDHIVGSGKTLIMIAAAIKMKQVGIANKPVITALKSTIPHIAEDAKKFFPNAKILAPTAKEMAPKNRARMFAQMQSNDYDIIILSHEQVGMIPHSSEMMNQVIEEELNLIETEIMSINSNGDNSEPSKRALKGLETRKNNLEVKMKEQQDKMKKDKIGVTFDQIGIDHVFIDESQMFKNLSYATKINSVAGMGDPSGNDRTLNMLSIVRYLQKLHGGDKGTTFLSGTPISNSLVEMYLLFKYLRPSKMEKLGFHTFDAWVKNFAKQETKLEFSVTGDVKMKTRFSRFVNVPELAKMYREISDIRNDSNLKLDKPSVKGGKANLVAVEQNAAEKEWSDKFMEFAKQPHGQRDGSLIGISEPLDEGKQKSAMLMVTMASAKLAIDRRLIDPNAEFNPNGKLAKVSEEIKKRYDASENIKGTQIVFSDLGTPKSGDTVMDTMDYLYEELGYIREDIDPIFNIVDKNGDTKTPTVSEMKNGMAEELGLSETEVNSIVSDARESAKNSFNVYNEVRRLLVEKGIPEKEVAFIHEYNTEAQKQTLFRKVNNGEIRVVIGSTQKLGTGVNIQKRAIAVHHIDAPWRPSDMEQRNGRAVRQKNMNKEVEILQYGTKGTLDAYKYELISIKQRYIEQVKNEASDRTYDDSAGQELSASEFVAMLSNNPLLLEKAQNEAKIEMLKRRRRTFIANKASVEGKIKKSKEQLSAFEKSAESRKNDLKTLSENSETREGVVEPSVIIKGVEPKDSKERNKIINEEVEKAMKRPVGESIVIGNIGGFDLVLNVVKEAINSGKGLFERVKMVKVALKGELEYPISKNTYKNGIKRMPKDYERLLEKISELEDDIKGLENLDNDNEWPGKKEYEDLVKRQNQVNDELLKLQEEEEQSNVSYSLNEDEGATSTSTQKKVYRNTALWASVTFPEDNNPKVIIKLLERGAKMEDKLRVYAPVYLDLLQNKDKRFYNRGLKLIQDTDYMDKADGDPREALEMALKDKALGNYKGSDESRSKIARFASRFWVRVKKYLNLNVDADQLSDMTIGEFLDIASSHLTQRKDIIEGIADAKRETESNSDTRNTLEEDPVEDQEDGYDNDESDVDEKERSTGTDTGTETDTGTDTETGNETDTGTDTETGNETDAGTDTETGNETDAGTGANSRSRRGRKSKKSKESFRDKSKQESIEDKYADLTGSTENYGKDGDSNSSGSSMKLNRDTRTETRSSRRSKGVAASSMTLPRLMAKYMYSNTVSTVLSTIDNLSRSLSHRGIKVFVHENAESYVNAGMDNGMSESDASNAQGFYSYDSKEVHINLSDPMLKSNVALHEAFHPIVREILLKDKGLFNKLVSELMNDVTLRRKYYEKFGARYKRFGGDTSKEEALVEYAADQVLSDMLSLAAIDMNKNLFDRLMSLIKMAAGKLSNIFKRKSDLEAFISTLSDAVLNGDGVELDTKNSKIVKEVISGDSYFDKSSVSMALNDSTLIDKLEGKLYKKKCG